MNPTDERRRYGQPPEGVYPGMLERSPPHSLEAERGVLGSVMLDPSRIDEVAAIARAEDFYSPTYRTVYQGMLGLQAENRPIDLLILAHRLERTEALDSVTIGATMAEVVDAVPTAANAVWYAQIIRDKARLRGIIHAATEALRDAYDQSCEPGEIVGRTVDKLEGTADLRDATVVDAKDLFPARAQAIEQRIRSPKLGGGIPSGLKDYDAQTGGHFRGELIVLAARPSMGKTALATQWALSPAFHGGPTFFCSLEMSRAELADRALCGLAGINHHAVRTGRGDSSDLWMLHDSAKELASARLFVDDRPDQRVADIYATAKAIKKAQGDLALVVVDYLQLITPSNDREKRDQQVARITKGLKILARRLYVPVVVLAQLNRETEKGPDHRPKLSHLRESGAIEQDADIVVFVHREEYYNRNDKALKGRGELIVAKNRNGPTGTVHVGWLKESLTFIDIAKLPRGEFQDAGDDGETFT